MIICLSFVSFSLLASVLALDTPCEGKNPGDECLFDEECYGENTICKKGKCVCPIGFELYAVDEDTVVCRPAPNKLGSECQSECKPPLLCRSGKCECWQGQIDAAGNCRVNCPRGQQLIGQNCVSVSSLGGPCQSDAECIQAFNICYRGRCACAPGTRLQGNICVSICPSGFPATQSCRRLFTNDRDILQHKSQGDSCPVGYSCVTYGKPNIGHCCPFYCPYGIVDNTRSCDPGASLATKCRQLTHFCHYQAGPGYKVSICCPRPCREPTPLYINGRCLPLAHLDDPCIADAQCEGGKAMTCGAKGRCQCRAGYLPTTKNNFPSCAQGCIFNQVEVLGDCRPVSRLGQPCVRSAQCPTSAHCFYGKCTCHCGYRSETLLNSCINPDDPLNLNSLIDSVGRFFGKESPARPFGDKISSG